MWEEIIHWIKKISMVFIKWLKQLFSKKPSKKDGLEEKIMLERRNEVIKVEKNKNDREEEKTSPIEGKPPLANTLPSEGAGQKSKFPKETEEAPKDKKIKVDIQKEGLEKKREAEKKREKEKEEEYIPTELQKIAQDLPVPLPKSFGKTKLTLLEVHPFQVSVHFEIHPQEFHLSSEDKIILEIWANQNKLFSGQLPSYKGSFEVFLPEDGLCVEGKLFALTSRNQWKLLYHFPSLQMGSQKIHPLPPKGLFVKRVEIEPSLSKKTPLSKDLFLEREERDSLLSQNVPLPVGDKRFPLLEGNQPKWEVWPLEDHIPLHILPIPSVDFIPWGIYWQRIG